MEGSSRPQAIPNLQNARIQKGAGGIFCCRRWPGVGLSSSSPSFSSSGKLCGDLSCARAGRPCVFVAWWGPGGASSGSRRPWRSGLPLAWVALAFGFHWLNILARAGVFTVSGLASKFVAQHWATIFDRWPKLSTMSKAKNFQGSRTTICRLQICPTAFSVAGSRNPGQRQLEPINQRKMTRKALGAAELGQPINDKPGNLPHPPPAPP